MSWRPLLEAAPRRAEVAAVIGEIAAAIDEVFDAEPARGGGDGQADRALLRAYLARDGTVDDPDDVVTRSLVAAIERTSAGGVGLFGGVSHTAWVIAHLASGEDADEVCGAIEQMLVRSLARPSARHDLIGGLAGFGVLALERRGGEAAGALAACVIEQLERLAVARTPGVAWQTAPELAGEHGGAWCAGLGYGSAGVVALLARWVAAGVETERCGRLLDAAVDHLRTAARAAGEGWCEGDLGVALALFAAAAARGREPWREDAIAIARRLAQRAPAAVPVVDAGVFRGAAGIAHMFHRLYRATGERELGEAARAWIDRTLALRRRGEPIAGFPVHRDGHGLQPVANLLMGATGVGLALHAAISDVEPAWDRILVVDV